MRLTLRNASVLRSLEIYSQEYFDSDRDLSTSRIKETLRLLGEVKGKAILDLGCGSGEGSTLLKHLGASVTSVDISRVSAFICREASLDSVQSASHILPFSDGAFDGVLFMDVIEHVPCPLVKQTLLEIKRVTKANGKIAIHTMPNLFLEKLSEFYGLINKRHWRRFGVQGGHINTYTVWKLKRDIMTSGLEIIEFKVGVYPSYAPFSRIVTPFSRSFKAFLGNDIWVCCAPGAV
jgi:2-polyprenyl-3-methyl-5-hydroxy-6-metoxy-1,4-benzoquinol methylase